MSDKHLINHLQRQPLHQGKAVPSHISTQPDPLNITGHKVLIFHPPEYRLAINRIYTRLSMFKGGLPSLLGTARMFSTLQEGRIWNLASISSSCDFLPETQDMEIDSIRENEIGAGSNLDQNLEQER